MPGKSLPSVSPRFSSSVWGKYQMLEEVEVWNHLDQGASANLPEGWPASHVSPLNLSSPDLSDSFSEIFSWPCAPGAPLISYRGPIFTICSPRGPILWVQARIPAPASNLQHITTSCGSWKDFTAGFVSTFPHLLGQPSCKAGVNGAVVWVGVLFLSPSLFVGKRLSNSVSMFPLQEGPQD